MKKIVPFNKVLKFNNSISEINSISLEHDFKDMGDSLSGNFVIFGDYIVDNDSRSVDKFNFTLPFDIALGVNYNKDNMVVDIDDFRYNIISNNEIEVDIDLYIDGEIIPSKDEDGALEDDILSHNDLYNDESNLDNNNDNNRHTEKDDDLDMGMDDKMEENKINDIVIDNDNVNININTNNNDNNKNMNIFDSIQDSDDYVTYRVYTVMENDTIDTILNKYNVSLEDLNKYNDTSNLKPQDKLIIPSDEK